jgi:paraquat-inducible protein B
MQLDGSSTVPIGSIVGGVIGGVCGLAVIIGILYYFLIYKKRSVVLDDSDEMVMSTVDPTESVYAISNNMESHVGDPNLSPLPDRTTEKPVVRPPNLRAKRINSYDSFTKPNKAKTAKEIAAMQRRERQKKIARQANMNLHGVVASSVNLRHSVATSVSTSNASNILPIAYIPGVTVYPTKNNTRSLFSADSDSVFSDLNTIENASIVGDVQRANGGNPAYISSSQNATTTAIKVQPKLVNVDKIEEESEGGDEFENTTDSNFDLDESSRISSVQSIHGNDIQLATMNEEESEDSDVDSDIENITRATSLRRPKTKDMLIDSPQTSTLHSSNTKETKTLMPSRLPSPDVTIDFDEKTKTGLAFFGDGSFILDDPFEK